MSTTGSNMIVLFGDTGPDVVRLSQIYDPDNDQYKLSEDSYAVVSPVRKSYWTRSYADKVVTFSPVPAGEIVATATPKANGWYEVNVGHEDQTGKYVPAERSTVVVDYDTELYKENMILVVKKVDNEITVGPDGIRRYPTFKSTLVPARSGTGEETSARALDYGNDRIMLYFDQQGDEANNVVLMPDRKLMIYGDKYYVYRLVRGNDVISTDRPVEKGMGSLGGHIPMIGAAEERCTIGPAEYKANTYAGKRFSYFSGTTLKRFYVPEYSPTANGYLSTLDEFYKAGKTYYLKQDNGGYVPLTAGRQYTVGEPVGVLNEDSLVYGVDALRICQRDIDIFTEPYTGWLNHDGSKQYVYFPSSCWLRTTTDGLVSGELVTFELFEYNDVNEFRLVMSTTLTAKEGTAIDASRVDSKAIAKFDVKLDGHDPSDVFDISQRSSVADLEAALRPYLVYDDGSQEELWIDDETCFCYGLDAISTANAGREYRLLFKYFRNVANRSIANAPRTFVSCVKTVRVLNDSADTIRRISLLPCWKNSTGSYVFKYLVYDNTFERPEIVDNLDSLLGSGTVVDGRKKGKQDNIRIENCLYKDDGGFIRVTTTPGSNLNYVQHGDMAMYVKADGYANSIYAQNIAFKLASWTTDIQDEPIKWLIGDDKDSTYKSEILKYGNGLDIRPYINCFKDEATGEYSFQIGTKFLNSLSNFKKAFYENAWRSSLPLIQPTHVLIRGFRKREYYLPLDRDLAIRGVKYYTGDGAYADVEENDGVTGLNVRRQAELTYYVHLNGKYTETTDGLPAVNARFTDEQRSTYYVRLVDDIESGYLSLSSTGDKRWSDTFTLVGASTSVEEIGGCIPAITDPDGSGRWNVQVMGEAIVEFCVLEGGVFKHLYGVPVEVRWPYVVTRDVTYGATNNYFVYDGDMDTFIQDPNYVRGEQIDHSGGRARYVRNL